MMRTIGRAMLAATLLLTTLAATPTPTDKLTTEQLLSHLSTSIDNLKTLRCTVRAKERVEGKYVTAQSTLKLTSSPLRVYLRNQKGIEALWVTGQNGGDAWVYPNSFPYVTLNLDPNGTLMRRDQHHSLLDAGFGSISGIIRGSTQRQDRAFERSFRYTGDTIVAGRPCHVLRSSFPQFRYVSYTPTKAETLTQIANKFGGGEFRIVERNDLSYEKPVPAGKTIQVPNSYGRRTTVCIDQKLMLPLVVEVLDDKGLFERFEFSNIVANQPIPSEEFAKGYKGYKL
ncbi:DUF1571 domain-containing protein [Hymenobacter aerilatus]|uniref:DUF1571 domain-containing protein n=1 Tax=Hymenobacter aerilatus TaxID=2932251 RepID=A0A8T9T3D0_9BACT|nr:DUF1571 domain-containing protein [Hymenobacter aerilatus]UOR06616.1 DUF1571 domain-containing protein [Hymenobacter aerilatus]